MVTVNVANDVEKNHNEETPIKLDILGNLPIDLVPNILFYLTPEDLRSAVSCCSRWKTATSVDYFWKAVCKREDYPAVEESQRSEFYSKFSKRYKYWQGVYWYNWTLGQNWMKGHYEEFTHEIKESGSDLFWGFFEDIFVVRSMSKKKLLVYNLQTTEFKQIVFSLRQEPDCESDKILKSGKYLSYFVTNKSLTVWDYKNEITVLDEFWNHVSNVKAFKNLFVLETQNKEKFQVFNIETRQIEYECRGIFKNLVIMDGRMLFLTQNNVINILKWDDKSLVTLECCSYPERRCHKFLIKRDLLLTFCIEDDEITSSLLTFLCVWNITTKTILHSIELENLDLGEASFINNYLYLNYFQGTDGDSNLLGRFKLMDCKKESFVASVDNLNKSSLVSNGRFIIASRSQNLILWCLKTKDFVCDLHLSFRRYYVHPTNLVMTKTKLAYVINNNYDSIILQLRDYEI